MLHSHFLYFHLRYLNCKRIAIHRNFIFSFILIFALNLIQIVPVGLGLNQSHSSWVSPLLIYIFICLYAFYIILKRNLIGIVFLEGFFHAQRKSLISGFFLTLCSRHSGVEILQL